jgi:hypothetical protein
MIHAGFANRSLIEQDRQPNFIHYSQKYPTSDTLQGYYELVHRVPRSLTGNIPGWLITATKFSSC